MSIIFLSRRAVKTPVEEFSRNVREVRKIINWRSLAAEAAQKLMNVENSFRIFPTLLILSF